VHLQFSRAAQKSKRRLGLSDVPQTSFGSAFRFPDVYEQDGRARDEEPFRVNIISLAAGRVCRSAAIP